MILAIRTDSPDVFVGLIDENGKVLVEKTWQADRELSQQILKAIEDLCRSQQKSLEAITGVIVYQGPGSYTGLRIGISVANTIGYANNIACIGVSAENWIKNGIEKLATVSDFEPVSPVYGSEVFTTKPKK